MSPLLLRIADLNDLLRTTFLTGKVVFTEGIRMLSDFDRSRVVEEVQSYRSITPDNEPYGEHDFGTIQIAGIGGVLWKIDYYDPSYRFGSDDPSDPTRTRRVLTIMLAEEY